MIMFIMLVTIISIGLLGIIIVIVYSCMTTKTLHNFCSALTRRQPSKMYISDEDYADRVCECERKERDRNSKELDSEFQKSIEFDGDTVQLESRSSSTSSDDSDHAMASPVQYCSHHPYRQCECTDRGEESDDQFGGYRATYDANICAMNTVHLSGMIV